MQIALLAERLRVEERLLFEAFGARGHEAVLFSPSSIHIGFDGTSVARIEVARDGKSVPFAADLALDRSRATTEGAALGALVANRGTAVVNRPATTRLLADRLAALRHLTFATILVAETIVSFGETATFNAIESLGYPVLLKSITADHGYPMAIIEDEDAAEAIVEHRVTLGDERGVLVQHFIHGPSRSIRLVVVDQDVAAVEQRALKGWKPAADAEYVPFEGDDSAMRSLGQRVIARLGSGTYSIEVLETEDGPTVVGVENLVDFRSIANRGIDISGQIADFALAQLSVPTEGELVGS